MVIWQLVRQKRGSLSAVPKVSEIISVMKSFHINVDMGKMIDAEFIPKYLEHLMGEACHMFIYCYDTVAKIATLHRLIKHYLEMEGIFCFNFGAGAVTCIGGVKSICDNDFQVFVCDPHVWQSQNRKTIGQITKGIAVNVQWPFNHSINRIRGWRGLDQHTFSSLNQNKRKLCRTELAIADRRFST